jgi:hypothetical protein
MQMIPITSKSLSMEAGDTIIDAKSTRTRIAGKNKNHYRSRSKDTVGRIAKDNIIVQLPTFE